MTNTESDRTPESPVARYAVEGRKLTAKVAKRKLFEPNASLKLSVFRIQDVGTDEVISIGISVAKKHATARNLYGWATVKRREVTVLGLVFEDDDEPPRHSNIVNWPDDRGKRKSLQQDLATVATPHLLGEPIPVE